MLLRRLVLILSMLVLPLQSSWAMAAGLCSHEAGVQAAHFGHHAHACEDDSAAPSPGQFSAHADCVSCQAPGAAGLFSSLAVPGVPGMEAAARPAPSRRFSSALSRAPDRPQWLRLV